MFFLTDLTQVGSTRHCRKRYEFFQRVGKLKFGKHADHCFVPWQLYVFMCLRRFKWQLHLALIISVFAMSFYFPIIIVPIPLGSGSIRLIMSWSEVSSTTLTIAHLTHNFTIKSNSYLMDCSSSTQLSYHRFIMSTRVMKHVMKLHNMRPPWGTPLGKWKTLIFWKRKIFYCLHQLTDDTNIPSD